MRSRFVKLLMLVMLVGLLMTGCEKLDYRKAVQLYNDRRYYEAIELFHALDDYEDSAALFTDSHYWAAMDRMEAGNYAEALPRFLKLGDYKDSAERAMECKYQRAIAAFEEEDFSTAENFFRELGNYRKCADYLRQIQWQKLYDYILNSGNEMNSGWLIAYPLPDRIVTFSVDPAVPNEIRMVSTWEKDMGYVFRESLSVIFPKDSTLAAFEANSEFTMTFGDGTIGSQQTASGTLDLRSYTPGMLPAYSEYALTVTDNHGQTTTSDDSFNSSMDEAMADHLVAIMDCFSALEVVSGTDFPF